MLRFFVLFDITVLYGPSTPDTANHNQSLVSSWMMSVR